MKKKMLLKHQGQFIQSPFLFPKTRFHILVAGYGAGKTSSISTAVENCVKLLQGRTDAEGHNPCIVLGGVSYAHLEKTTVAMIKQDLENSKTVYTHDKKLNTITIGNVTIVLVSLSEPQKIVGFNAWAAFGDEIDDLGSLSQADDLTFEAVKALNERTRQIIKGLRKPFLCFGSTSQGQKGLYRVYTQFIKTGVGFVLMRGSTRDNPHLDPDYVASLYKMYNETERKVFLEGHFLPISQGRVIGDFDWGRNFIHSNLDQHIHPDETVYWAQDFNTGYFRGCVGVERGGRIYIVKGYDFPEIRDAPGVVRHDFPHNKIVWIPDTTAKDQISHFTKELRKHRIHWITRSKNPLVEDSAFLVNKLLYTKRLFLTTMASEVAEALALAQRDKNGKIPKGIGPNSPIHYCFAGDTKVTTARGQVRIDRVKADDVVLTRAGWKRVTVSAYMGDQETVDMGYARLTPEHPVWTEENGMTPFGELTGSERLLTLDHREVKLWQRTKQLDDSLAGFAEALRRYESSTVSRGTDTHRPGAGATGTISARARNAFMSLCGSFITGLCLTVSRYTTRTGTLPTIRSAILTALLRLCTNAFQSVVGRSMSKDTSHGSGLRRQNGTAVSRAGRGTANMENVSHSSSSSIKSSWYAHAADAVTALRKTRSEQAGSAPRYAKTKAGTILEWMLKSGPASGAEKISRLTSVFARKLVRQAARRLFGGSVTESVYDISVDGQHEFFADGVLVSNCDGVRMLCYFLASNKSSLKDIRRVTIARHLEMYEEEPAVVDLEGGYSELNPAAIA